MKKLLIFFIAILFAGSVSAQSRDELVGAYLSEYQDIAIREMIQYRIPASITIAQGLLESGFGESKLSVSSNNHFGIKCKSNWTGRSVNHDDDAPQECFRAYDSVEDSYEDHSKFLAEGARYAFLFDYAYTDYKSWAHGLKKAGYATNPKYAYILIDLIEDYDLHDLDKGRELSMAKWDKEHIKTPVNKLNLGNIVMTNSLKPVYTHGGMKVYRNNDVDFIVAVKGDTYKTIAKRLGIRARKLARYNDIENTKSPVDGIVYIKRKSFKGAKGQNYHIVEKGETMYYLSQRYAIVYGWLCNRNDKTFTEKLRIGEKLRLR